MSCTIKDIIKGNMEVRHTRQTKQYLAFMGGLGLKSLHKNPAAFRREVNRSARVVMNNQKEEAKYRKLRAALGF